MSESTGTVWLPLESNPDVLNKYIYKLGVSKKWAITDVYGLEPDMLEWVPKPTKALILLFPITDSYEKFRAEEDEKLKSNPQKIPENLFFMKQIIRNACGTIALVHAIGNTDIDLNDGPLKKYLESTKNLSPEERGKALESNADFTDLHEENAMEGELSVPNPDEPIIHHFIAFIEKNGKLYELDGRKSFPIEHGTTNSETFLNDAAKVCKEFMTRDPDEVRFTVIALTAASD